MIRIFSTNVAEDNANMGVKYSDSYLKTWAEPTPKTSYILYKLQSPSVHIYPFLSLLLMGAQKRAMFTTASLIDNPSNVHSDHYAKLQR